MIVAASDLHGQLNKHLLYLISSSKLFLFAGDLAACTESRKIFLKYYGRKPPSAELKRAEKKDMEDSKAMLARFEQLNVPVCLVKGNAELYHTNSLPPYEDYIHEFHVFDLDGKIHKHDGLKIGGLGFFHEVEKLRATGNDNPEFVAKTEADEREAKKKLKKLHGIDILLTHDPPQGFLDMIDNPNAPPSVQGKHIGSFLIRKFIEKEQPKFHICGHIHEGQGQARLGNTTVLNVGSSEGKIALLENDTFRFE